jgi:hypothetical protein
MRFVVPVPSVYARPNPKYFGRRGGATWLNMINDQAAGLGGKVVAGTPRDSLDLLDVLYDRDGGKRPKMIVTDTASYSDIVFGLLTLAGFAYAPQLADLPDQKMWRIDRTADYGAFTDAARGRVDLERIERHWEDILRIIGSIHTGAVRAYDVIRMLSRDGRPTPLGDAIAHYGRIAKALHILRLADDVRTASHQHAGPLLLPAPRSARRDATVGCPGLRGRADPGCATAPPNVGNAAHTTHGVVTPGPSALTPRWVSVPSGARSSGGGPGGVGGCLPPAVRCRGC